MTIWQHTAPLEPASKGLLKSVILVCAYRPCHTPKINKKANYQRHKIARLLYVVPLIFLIIKVLFFPYTAAVLMVCGKSLYDQPFGYYNCSEMTL